MDQHQAGHFVGPDLGPNCLQRLSADDKSRQSQTMFVNCSRTVFLFSP